MASLTGTKIKDTYDGLLKTTDNGGLGATEKEITDGLGNGSGIYLGTNDRLLIARGNAIDSDTKLQVSNGTSGVTSVWANADDVVFEGSANFGITIATPNTGAATLAFVDTDSVNTGYVQYVHTDDSMRFGTDTSEAMRIDSSGNVGIGTASPDAPLEISSSAQVSGDARYQMLITEDNTASAGRGGGLAFTRQGIIYGGIKNIQNTSNDANTSMSFQTRGSGVVAERMRILSSGGLTFNGDTSTSNALDDYEEGTFTVTNAGDATGTIDAAGTSGEYTKIGNVVYFRIVVRAATNFTSALLGGLPYIVGGDSKSSLFGAFNANNSSSADLTVVPKRASQNIELYSSNLVGSTTPFTTAMSTIRVAGLYFV
jgi:hypothetical protein